MPLYLVTVERYVVEQSVVNTTDEKQAAIVATTSNDHAARLSTTHRAPNTTVVKLRPDDEERP